ncbi:trypsin delta-like [Anopheles maculipalpis]|uniref:trypsin delta-like n=1 Tax=Anopheles maculipalpis TaxID=1496333 RepID=UPI002158ED30|nr:trypsin delta-like [Anopheles maculipalpis]
MKQVTSLVLLVLFCTNAVLAGKANETKANGASQSGRIINGYEVNIDNYRYPLSLWTDGSFTCGASIITASHALTAAHCVDTVVSSPWRVTLYGGSSYLNSPAVRIPVGRIAVHPYYNPRYSYNYDAAVLTVPSNAFAGKPNMAGIALQNSDVPAGTPCFVVGWGRYALNSQSPSNSLRYTNLYIVSESDCSASFQVTSDQVCARNYYNMETCSGDSGSALVCNGRLTGLVSYGLGGSYECTSAAPTVFAKVLGPSIRDFIRRQTGI